MFAGGFQYLAFQTAANNNQPSGNGKFSFVYPYQKLLSEKDQREKIKEIKTSIVDLESEIFDVNQRLRTDTLTKKTRVASKLNRELKEILALLQTKKAGLMRRLRNEEAILIILIAAKKRRSRAI